MVKLTQGKSLCTGNITHLSRGVEISRSSHSDHDVLLVESSFNFIATFKSKPRPVYYDYIVVTAPTEHTEGH